MKYTDIIIHPRSGVAIELTIREAITVAFMMNEPVVLDFNGTAVRVAPFDTVENVYRMWRSKRKDAQDNR